MKRILLSLLVIVPSAYAMAAQNFAFSIDPTKTWTDGYARVLIYTNGSFKGTYVPVTNVSGTQTKAGPGSFSLNDNDSILASPFLELGRAALVRTSGTFNLSVDTAALTATLTTYVANRVPTNSLKLSATVALNNEMFQSLKPSFSFPSHLAPQSLGMVTIDEFKVKQHEGARTASIVPLGGGKYSVAISFMAEVEMNVQEFGQSIPVKFNTPYSLVGTLQVNGTAATFGFGPGRGGENFSRAVNIQLQPFPFFIPNGSGTPASLIMSTTVTRIGLQVNGVRKMFATVN